MKIKTRIEIKKSVLAKC